MIDKPSPQPYTVEHFKVEPAEIAEGWRVNMGDSPHLVFEDRADAAMTAAALRYIANRAYAAGQAQQQWIGVDDVIRFAAKAMKAQAFDLADELLTTAKRMNGGKDVIPAIAGSE